MALNCEGPGRPGPPCGECVPCRKILSGNHPDVRVLAPEGRAGKHKIEAVREIREELNLRPFEGRTKVLLVRAAERFSEESGGAFLKTLEEPSPNTFIAMTAHTASGVMSTLVSRCVVFRIPQLPRAEILRALKERKAMAGPDADLLAGLSGGAMGRALATDLELARAIRTGIEEVFTRRPGPARTSQALRQAASMAQLYTDLKGDKDDPDNAAAADWLELLELSLRLWWRDAAVLGVSGDEALLEGPPPSAALRALARELTPESLAAFEAACGRMADSLRRFIRPDLVFENFWSAVLS
jgi:DNA polymerase-3 subunit delta'